MLLLKRRFRRSDNNGMESGRVWFCARGFVKVLRKHFHLPKNVQVVWVSLHDQSGRNRLPVSIQLNGGCSILPQNPALIIGKEEAEDEHLDNFLKPLIGKTVYMAVEYEEA